MRTFQLLSALVLSSCHSAGPYGHAKIYAASSDETRVVATSTEYDALLAERAFDKVKNKPVWLFGIVTNRGSGPGGAAYMALSLRTLQQRNLCENEDEDSCRVTVGDREMGRVHVLVALTAEDELGEHGVGIGSLLRVAGNVTSDFDPNDGTRIVRASFYRHWPRGFYVTARAAGYMRR